MTIKATKKPELLPCPFCGSNNIGRVENGLYEICGVELDFLCRECGAKASSDRWNTRYNIEPVKESEQLEAYREAVNKFDDHFEYANESLSDRKRVHMILSELTEKLSKSIGKPPVTKGEQ